MKNKLTSFELVNLFTTFLNDCKAYKKYEIVLAKKSTGPKTLTAFVNYMYDCGYTPDALIDQSFTWSNTPQGHEYWSTMESKWGVFLRKNIENRVDYNSIW